MAFFPEAPEAPSSNGVLYLIIYLFLNVLSEMAEDQRIGIFRGVKFGHVQRREKFLRLLLSQHVVLGHVFWRHLHQCEVLRGREEYLAGKQNLFSYNLQELHWLHSLHSGMVKGGKDMYRNRDCVPCQTNLPNQTSPIGLHRRARFRASTNAQIFR